MDYRTRIVSSLAEIGPSRWDALVTAQAEGNPFLSYAFLHALHESGSASPESGWEPHYLTLWQADGEQEQLVAALPLYRKFHSYGEYAILCIIQKSVQVLMENSNGQKYFAGEP